MPKSLAGSACLGALLLALCGAGRVAPATADDREPQVRQFRIVYGATITGLEPGQKAKVWAPVAKTNADQTVRRVSVSPKEAIVSTESKFGNDYLYFSGTANSDGEIPLEVTYLVERHERKAGQGEPMDPTQRELFLESSSMVPVDGRLIRYVLGDGTAQENDTLTLCRKLYDAVDGRMKYDKPADSDWGRGDALWACDNGFGNCTDFHSMFIGACRDLGIPAKFEIGFTVPEGTAGPIGGYHCWGKFTDGKTWHAVDISEADKNPELRDYYFGNLSPNRFTLSTGRDLQLNPRPAAGKINFLAYPYVEVDGRQHKLFKKQFSYEEVDSIE